MKSVGHLGELLLARWLKSQDMEVLAQNWQCRWGELDIVAQAPDQTLLFIEVKTRQAQSLDQGGLLAINQNKQTKVTQAALLFLADNPELAERSMRFDVALLVYQRAGSPLGNRGMITDLGTGTIPGQGEHQFWLVDYIPDAFTP